MSSVLGVSVGAGAVRMARPHTDNPHGPIAAHSFDVQSIPVGAQNLEELTAEAIGVTLAGAPEIGATAIAYRSDQHARAIRSAMARQQLTNYDLVPEVIAALEFVQSTGDVRGISSLVVYDLGASGLTVSVVDTHTREVRYSERTSDISGDYIDSLVREQQLASGRIAHPADEEGLAELDGMCRDAKEQLSTDTAVALPSDQGLVLLSLENFESLIMLAIESSARMTRDVIVRSDRPVHGVLAIGGGARIPLVAKVLERWMSVPVVVPESPETVMSRGAALLARPVKPPVRIPDPIDDDDRTPSWLTTPTRRSRSVGKREVSGAVLTVSALTVVAAIGLALGYGPQVLERDSHSTEGSPSTQQTTAPPTTTHLPAAVLPTQTMEHESLAAPPPRAQPDEPAGPPPPPGPNTVVVPGLPPIVIPTLPPVQLPFPPAP